MIRSSSGGFLFSARDLQRQPGHERHETRALEARVINGQAAIILAQADGDQFAHIDVGTKLLGTLDGEIVVGPTWFYMRTFRESW